jgi:hypothetical protein
MIEKYLELIKISEKIDRKKLHKISSAIDSIIQDGLEEEFDVVCSWCKKMKIGDTWVEEEPSGEKRLTHTICPECFKKFFG